MISNRRIPWLPVLLAVTMLPVSAGADAAPDAPDVGGERPRIGLVLGGGGARGAAHIGVLRELERLRVPIDAIAGTSMGAFVGGLYASGRSAAEIEELMRTIDWSDAMSDTPRREDLNFRRKEDDGHFPFKFELGIGEDGVKLPKGLVTGHRLDLLLHSLTIDVAHIKDFDKLPIPFRAVASNIETAEAHVIGDGDLALAIRASMSVPGILAPTVIGEHLLVDGGLVGNLPINAARAMDVDIIIAVDAEFPLYARDELDSAIKVSEQMLTILIRKETRRQIGTMGPQDILIRPELGTFASTDFAQIMSVVEPGAEAAVAVDDRLQRIALDRQAYAEHVARRPVPGAIKETLAFVRVVHDDGLEDKALVSRVLATAGDPIDPRKLTADSDRLYGLGMYEQVGYRLVEESGGTGVEYRVRTKSWGSNTMLFGISLQDDFDGSASLNLNTRITRVGLNSRGAEWRTDLQLGTEPVVFTEVYQPPIAGSRWFMAPRVELRRSDVKTFEMQEPVSELRISEAQAGLDLGRRLGYTGEVRVGVWRGTGKSEVKVGDPSLTNSDFESGGLFAGLRMDTVDDAHFPTRGMQAELWWRGSRTAFGADKTFDAYSAKLSKTWTLGRNSLDLGVTYATSSDADPDPQDLFSLGGFQRLSGVQRGAISGPHTALARIVFRRRISDSAGGLLDTPIYLGASLEAGNAWQQRSDISFGSALVNGSVFAGLDTLIGPVFLGAGFVEGGSSNYYLFIGAPPR